MGGIWELSRFLILTATFVHCRGNGLTDELRRMLQQSQCDDGLGAVVAQQATELSSLDRFLQEVKREIQAMKRNHPAASSQLDAAKKYIQATKKYYQATEKYLQATKEDLRVIRPKLAVTQIELEDAKRDLQAKKAEHRSVRAELQDTKTQLEAATTELESAKVSAQAAEEKHEYTKTELKSTMEDFQSTKAELQSTKKELQSTKAEFEAAKAELRSAKTQLQSMKAKLQTVEAERRCNDTELDADRPRLDTEQTQLPSNASEAHVNDTGFQANETSAANWLCSTEPKDCQQIRRCDNQSGVAIIYPGIPTPVTVYCDQDTDGGGWAVIQRRIDGSKNFNRNWTDYQAGFGNLTTEFWLGLDVIYNMTASRELELRVDLTMWNGTTAYATYSNFTIGTADDNYTLDFSNFTGGDAGDSLSLHRGLPFSTYDRDNDPLEEDNCAESLSAAWWYGLNTDATNTTTTTTTTMNTTSSTSTNSTLSRACRYADLNGVYKSSNETAEDDVGLVWFHLAGWGQSLKSAEMKLRPATPYH